MRAKLGANSTMADRLGVPEISLDYEQVCARNDIDAVTIATQTWRMPSRQRLRFQPGSMSFVKSRSA